MNTRRLVVLLLAAGAAGVVALVVRGFVGGGAKQAEARVAPAPVEIARVLVAATRLNPGRPVLADQVRWQAWPLRSVDGSFIRQSGTMSSASIVEGMVVRAPMVDGEPVTFAKIVKSGSSGFMAATIAPGMRAVSISVSVASVAGGFILPNNRVDIILTMVTNDSPKRGVTRTVLNDVRVLAMDQAFNNTDQKASPDVKTVTLELTPEQARTVSAAQAMGVLSLALRGLGDEQTAAAEQLKKTNAAVDGDDQSGIVTVIRYGSVRRSSGGGGAQ
jgi:pilus assembly protein CpaB